MKKVLFATTAVSALAFAGSAYAEAHLGVSFSGAAEFGGKSVDDGTTTTTGFHSDLALDISFTGEADNGITFGASAEIEAQSGEDTTDDTADFDDIALTFSQDAIGTFTFGDTDSGYDRAVKGVDSAGINDSADFYLSGDDGLDEKGDDNKRILRWDYDFGPAAFSLSYEDNDDNVGDSGIIGVGIAGEVAGWDLALGYQTGEEAGVSSDVIGASVGGSLGPVDVKLLVQDGAIDAFGDDFTAIDVSAVYNMDPITVGVNFATRDNANDETGYGAWFEYDLGGGLAFLTSAGTEESGGVDETRFDIGFTLSF